MVSFAEVPCKVGVTHAFGHRARLLGPALRIRQHIPVHFLMHLWPQPHTLQSAWVTLRQAVSVGVRWII